MMSCVFLSWDTLWLYDPSTSLWAVSIYSPQKFLKQKEITKYLCCPRSKVFSMCKYVWMLQRNITFVNPTNIGTGISLKRNGPIWFKGGNYCTQKLLWLENSNDAFLMKEYLIVHFWIKMFFSCTLNQRFWRQCCGGSGEETNTSKCFIYGIGLPFSHEI